MIDVLVLDEADRMIADGHFKEMEYILGHIYTRRVEIKKEKMSNQKNNQGQEQVNETEKKEVQKFSNLKNCIDTDEFFIGKNTVNQNALKSKVDWSKVKDLVDEDAMLDQM